jgi:hypothetical protein
LPRKSRVTAASAFLGVANCPVERILQSFIY